MQTLREQIQPDIDFAFVEFGLPEEQFLLQTPREWQRRIEAWQRREARTDRRVARLCMVMAWCAGDEQATEDTFMPQPIDDTPQTPEEMIAALKAATRYVQ